MDERGSGLIQLWVGFVVFLVMLLFAVQLLFNLYAVSVVTAVSYDAARRVAGGGGQDYIADAEADARAALGRYQDKVSFDWGGTNGEEVVLRVRTQRTSVLLPVLAGPLAFDTLDRTIRVRVERFR